MSGSWPLLQQVARKSVCDHERVEASPLTMFGKAKLSSSSQLSTQACFHRQHAHPCERHSAQPLCPPPPFSRPSHAEHECCSKQGVSI